MNRVAPLLLWSCTRPGTLERNSAFTGSTYRLFRTVMIGSCSAFCSAAEWIIWFSLSLIRSWAPRRCRRMFISSLLARSAISSSLIIASVISFSMFRAVNRPSAFARRIGVFSRSVTRASRAARLARSSSATLSSMPVLRLPPFSQITSAGRMSGKAVMGCPPVYCRITAASSVSAWRAVTSWMSSEGARARHFSAPLSVSAPSASISRILVNSSTRSVLSLIIFFTNIQSQPTGIFNI